MKKLILFSIFIVSFIQITYAQEDFIPIESSETFLGAKAKGFMTIRYSSINPGDNNLRRPLIVAEGFDPAHLTMPEVATGYYDIRDFLLDATNDGSNLNTVLDRDFASFYDVIFIDWKKGTDYIRRNALLVKEVIRYVNAHKVAVGGVMQQNAVIGLSMGGLCARWALKDMEDNSENHQTRLLVTWDSPHQGANVPEGYQRLARHARDFYVLTGGTAVAAETVSMFFGTTPLRQLNLASMPACREMLVNYVSDIGTIDNSVHDAWQADLRAKGYPQGFGGNPLRVVAVSNGSECAKPQDFNPGDNLLTYQGEAVSIGALGEMAATMTVPILGAMITNPAVTGLGIFPGRNQFSAEFLVNAKAAVGTGNQVYKGAVTYKKKILNLINVNVNITSRSKNADASTLPYDYYPGGFYDIRDIGLDLQSSSWSSFLARFEVTASYIPTFCFVPVASALDIGSGNVILTDADYLTPYRGASPPTGTKASPFPNFITAFQGNPDNEEHIDIHTRNGDWFANELSNILPNTPVSCLFACPGFTLTPAQMCNNTTLNVSLFLPQGATATWNAPSWVTVTPQNTQGSEVLVTSGSSSGLANLGISINPGTSGCGTGSVLLSQLVKVGAPNYYTLTAPYTTEGYSDYLHQDGEGTNCLKTYTFPGMYSGDIDLSDVVADSYTWTFVSKSPSSATVSIGSLTTPQHVTVTVKPQNAQVTYQLTTSNSCGSYSANYTFRADGYCVGTVERPSNISSISVSPNPVSGKCSVILTPGNSDASIRQIQILDKFGVTLKQYKYKAGELTQTVGMESLKPDIYVLQVFDGTTWISTKVAKE